MTIRPETRELARRLLIYESERGKSGEAELSSTRRVYEKLRENLSAFAGAAAFQALASRALALARSENPGLREARVAEDGSLEGLGPMEYPINSDKQPGADPLEERGVIVIARLLGLLHIFLGEASTLSLLRVAWPGATFEDRNSENGRKT